MRAPDNPCCNSQHQQPLLPPKAERFLQVRKRLSEGPTVVSLPPTSTLDPRHEKRAHPWFSAPHTSIYSGPAAALMAKSSSYSVQAWEEWCRWIELNLKLPFIPFPQGTAEQPQAAAVGPNPDQVFYSLHIYSSQRLYKILIKLWCGDGL